MFVKTITSSLLQKTLSAKTIRLLSLSLSLLTVFENQKKCVPTPTIHPPNLISGSAKRSRRKARNASLLAKPASLRATYILPKLPSAIFA